MSQTYRSQDLKNPKTPKGPSNPKNPKITQDTSRPRDRPSSPWFLEDLRLDQDDDYLLPGGVEPQAPGASPRTPTTSPPRSAPPGTTTPTKSDQPTPRLDEVIKKLKKLEPPAPKIRRVPPSVAVHPPQSKSGRVLEFMPDKPSNKIQRVINYRIKKPLRAKGRGRLTKDPKSSPFHCKSCKVTCNARPQWLQHLRSKGHRSNTGQDHQDLLRL